MNDWYVAAAVLAALWLVVRSGDPAHARARAWAGAGLLVGAAAGLKLTGAIYGVGLLAAALAAGGSAPLACGAGSALAMAVAFAVTAGPWMATMYERYGNPLFPYFNDVFRSPWADPVSYSATRFGPATSLEWLVFPVPAAGEARRLRVRAGVPRRALALLYTLALAALALLAAATPSQRAAALGDAQRVAVRRSRSGSRRSPRGRCSIASSAISFRWSCSPAR